MELRNDICMYGLGKNVELRIISTFIIQNSKFIIHNSKFIINTHYLIPNALYLLRTRLTPYSIVVCSQNR